MSAAVSNAAELLRILLTPEDAAERLSLSRTVIYELIRTGELRSVKIGRARRIPVDALTEYVECLSRTTRSDDGRAA